MKRGLRTRLVARVLLMLLLPPLPAWAHDENHDHDEWYQSLNQPDNPTMSCCGLADAYWEDEYYVKDGKTYAVITDNRDDGPLRRPHVPSGTVIEVPNYKLKWDRSNPTGHTIIFLTRERYVYCFVQSTGI